MALLMSLALLDLEVDPESVESLKNKIRGAIDRCVDATARLEDRIVWNDLPVRCPTTSRC